MSIELNMDEHKRILEYIHIKRYDEVMSRYVIEDRDLVNFMTLRRFTVESQTGGGPKRITYSLNGNDFILFERMDEYGVDISVHRKNDIDDPQLCLHIQIDTDMHLAYINNISYYHDCVKTGLQHPGGGRILLKMAIQYLSDNKSKYNLSRIQLKDNSLYPCNVAKKNIKLPLMHTLIFGDTWYGKYGFRPYDPDLSEPDNVLLEFYNENKSIIQKTKISDTNLFGYLYRALREEQPNVSKDIIQKRIQYMRDKYSKLTIGKFFKEFLVMLLYCQLGIFAFLAISLISVNSSDVSNA